MAYNGKIIRNPYTGHEMKFLQTAADTNGELLEIEATYHAASKPPPPHYHPEQEEDFRVIEGTVLVRLDSWVQELKAGETLHIPHNVAHSMWNPFNVKAVVNWQVRPALDTEYFLETGTGLASDGKIDEKGRPSLLQLALLARKFAKVYRLAWPSYPLQKILFSILAPFAYLKGYRSVYKKYLN